MKRAMEYELKVNFRGFCSETPTEMTVTFDHIAPEKVLEYADLLEQSVNCMGIQIRPRYEVDE